MEPRGSGASKVGQRPWSSSLEILCWFCLLPFCWWVQQKQMLHSCFFFLPISTGAIPVQVLCCTDFIAYGSYASGKGTPRSGDRQTDGGHGHAGAYSSLHSLERHW